MIDKQAPDHEVKNGAFDLKCLQKTRGECHEAHLGDRRIAEQSLRSGLLQPDQVRKQERDRAQRGKELKLAVEQRQQLQQRKEHAGGDATRNERRDVTTSSLVYIQTPP